MNIEPLNKDIYNKALAMGVNKIILEFSGGSDEGYLDVSFEPPLCQPEGYTRGYPSLGRKTDELTKEVETWAWDTYNYSGAGDGSDYGDEIVYDLVNKKCSTKEWCMVREISPGGEVPLEIDNVEAIESDDE